MHEKTRKGIKYALAALGAVYIVLFVGYLLYAAIQEKPPAGPSELELYPERQAEIKAKERAEEMKERLGLSEEQTEKVAELFRDTPPPMGPPMGGDDQRMRYQAFQEGLTKILTEEQRSLMEQIGPPGGPGGGPGGEPGGRRRGGPPRMDPERLEAVKEAMTPEQRERFEKRMEEMRQRMPFRRRGPGGPGGPGGQESPPPPPPM